jgi:hypothetical protein
MTASVPTSWCGSRLPAPRGSSSGGYASADAGVVDEERHVRSRPRGRRDLLGLQRIEHERDDPRIGRGDLAHVPSRRVHLGGPGLQERGNKGLSEPRLEPVTRATLPWIFMTYLPFIDATFRPAGIRHSGLVICRGASCEAVMPRTPHLGRLERCAPRSRYLSPRRPELAIPTACPATERLPSKPCTRRHVDGRREARFSVRAGLAG